MEQKKQYFEYIQISPKSREKLNIIMEEIRKLNIAKQNYSIQELQSINMLSKKQSMDNKRILEEANVFLDTATNIGMLKKFNAKNKENRERFGEFIDERDIDEKININVEDLKNKIYTLADLSFKANKYTKLLCEQAISLLIDNNYAFEHILKQMKKIYNKSNKETGIKVNEIEELQYLMEHIKNGQYAGWEENINSNVQNEEIERDITSLYSDLVHIWDLENVLYEMKTQLNKQLVRCLIKDKRDLNEQNFKNWGFSLDRTHGVDGMWVLNFDPRSAVDRYAYHVPELSKILGRNLLRSVTGLKIFDYQIHFASSVRKNDLDRVKNKYDNKELMRKNKADIIKMFTRQDIDVDQYTIAKFMSEEDFEDIKEECPELRERCEELKKLVLGKEQYNIDDQIYMEIEQNTAYEESIREQIEENIKTYKRIYVQYGENLDKNAALYAIQKHMEQKGIDNIEIIEINAGEKRDGIYKNGLFLDAGFLKGCSSFNSNYKGSKEINANESRAQKSTSGVLSQYGIYVPKKIVQYADEVIDDERVLNARYGLYLCRKLRDEKLFEFAKSQREDGTYLIESTLTDEELKKWKLFETFKKREEEIKKDLKTIADNIYIINENQSEKYICVVDKYVNCGSWIAYSLGCDYYLSIADKNAQFIDNSQNSFEYQSSKPKATFCMLANPKKGEGKLPEQVIEWSEELRDNEENDMFEMISINEDGKSQSSQKPFVSPKKDKVIFGGLKTPNLFIVSKGENRNVSQDLFETMKSVIGFEEIELKKKREMIKKTIKRKSYTQAKEIINELLQEIKDNVLTKDDVYKEGEELLRLAQERGEDIAINRS